MTAFLVAGGLFGVPLLYVASPPFAVTFCRMVGTDWALIRDTFYLPLVLLFGTLPNWAGQAFERYCEFVLALLGQHPFP